ncbi:MAG: hypothetical protein ACXWUS_16785 [Burkholderiales bacterium]
MPGNPGAGSDIFARVIADIIRKEKLVSQPIILNNKAGGGGAIAAVYAAQKRGDPYFPRSLSDFPVRSGC